MTHFLRELSSLVFKKPYLSFLTLILFLIGDNTYLDSQIDILETIESAFLGLFVSLALPLFIVWVQTRIYKFYMLEKRKWWFDIGDVKAILTMIVFFILYKGIMHFGLELAELWLNTFGMSADIYMFIRDHGLQIIGIALFSILFRFVIFYPISMVAGDHLTLVESIKKLGHYVWLLIAISLFASFIELKKQTGTQDLQLFWDVAKGLISYASLICTITAYKIQVTDKKQAET